MGRRETIFSKLWGGSKAYFQEQNCCFREGIAWDPKPPQTLWKWHLMVFFSLVQKGWVNHLKVARFEPRLLWKGWVPWFTRDASWSCWWQWWFFSCGRSLGYTLYTKLLFHFQLILLNLLKFRTAEGSTSMHFHPFCFHFPCGKDYEWQESTKSPLEISALLGSWATDWSWSGDRWRWIWWVSQDLGYGMDMDI